MSDAGPRSGLAAQEGQKLDADAGSISLPIDTPDDRAVYYQILLNKETLTLTRRHY
jgi:hypothetical protein